MLSRVQVSKAFNRKMCAVLSDGHCQQLHVVGAVATISVRLSGNPWLYLFLWWVPMITLFSLFYRIRSITEHSGVEGGDDFKNTRTTKVPWYLSYFLAPLNVNYHVEHHLFTFCPWYNLPMAHKMLRAKGHTSKMEIANGYGEVFKKVLTAN